MTTQLHALVYLRNNNKISSLDIIKRENKIRTGRHIALNKEEKKLVKEMCAVWYARFQNYFIFNPTPEQISFATMHMTYEVLDLRKDCQDEEPSPPLQEAVETLINEMSARITIEPAIPTKGESNMTTNIQPQLQPRPRPQPPTKAIHPISELEMLRAQRTNPDPQRYIATFYTPKSKIPVRVYMEDGTWTDGVHGTYSNIQEAREDLCNQIKEYIRMQKNDYIIIRNMTTGQKYRIDVHSETDFVKHTLII